jgi:hypothetical protein
LVSSRPLCVENANFYRDIACVYEPLFAQNGTICAPKCLTREPHAKSTDSAAAGPSRGGRDQRAPWRAARPGAPRTVSSTRWVGATATVSDGSPSAVAARRATHANDHQRVLPIHRHGTLPSGPQMVQPVTPWPVPARWRGNSSWICPSSSRPAAFLPRRFMCALARSSVPVNSPNGLARPSSGLTQQ